MTRQYDETNRFVLFPNNKKRDDKDRDWNGTINIDGKEYWLNGYNRKGGVVGGMVKPKEDAERRAEVVRETRSNTRRDLNDEVPW